ncbi:hypothetical protein N7493_006852 [Penicillium malachiteum]|uniref:Major facilitator superfamily (MFS) profile domain-containing protein n=1 Tax=Penicillium malachiteum TaxID=1324776 RepID=A0AAD6HJS1_9EURO|nr:hypothetical protein N7493_006852 [Penicillium malachiteum]
MEEPKVENEIPEVDTEEVTNTTRSIKQVPTNEAVIPQAPGNIQPGSDEIDESDIQVNTCYGNPENYRPVSFSPGCRMFTSSALQPATGKLYAHFSIKYTYISFIRLFELGSLICGVATSSNMFIVGRVVAGMGSAGVGNGALTIVSAMVPLEKRALYFSNTASFGQLGVVFGPLIGGALTEYTTWRWCFYLNLPIGGFAVAALLWVAVPKLNRENPKRMGFVSLFHELDIMGCLLFSPTMIMFLLALQWDGSTYP